MGRSSTFAQPTPGLFFCLPSSKEALQACNMVITGPTVSRGQGKEEHCHIPIKRGNKQRTRGMKMREVVQIAPPPPQLQTYMGNSQRRPPLLHKGQIMIPVW